MPCNLHVLYIIDCPDIWTGYSRFQAAVFRTSCIKVSGSINCQYCKGKCQKAGKQRNGAQKLYCGCQKYQQANHKNRAYEEGITPMIAKLICESVNMRGIARVLRISVNTVLARIKRIARTIERPVIAEHGPVFEVDELWTYIGRNDNEYWLAYALNKITRQVVDLLSTSRPMDIKNIG